MEKILQSFELLIQRHGVGAYFGIAGLIIFYIIGFVSVWLLIGMLIYSIFSKNWNVWKKWKYIGWLALLGLGLMITGLLIRAISAQF